MGNVWCFSGVMFVGCLSKVMFIRFIFIGSLLHRLGGVARRNCFSVIDVDGVVFIEWDRSEVRNYL